MVGYAINFTINTRTTIQNGDQKNIVQLTRQENPFIEIIITATYYPIDTYRNHGIVLIFIIKNYSYG